MAFIAPPSPPQSTARLHLPTLIQDPRHQRPPPSAEVSEEPFFMTYKGPLMVTDDLLLQGLRNASSLVPLVWFMQRMVMLLPRDNNREADMRTVSERTNSTVAWFSILSLGVCVAVSVLQLWHLQGFFRKKKLI
eukprot:XP_020398641.1 transmembrane emp24 domain-containing protein bai-like [Zea mays]